MIGFLRGRVAHLLTEYCLLDVGGVGYRVYITSTTRSRLRFGEEATLFTHLSVREDALLLYGFSTQEEYNLFQLLISVSGVGPKVALGILSAISADGLCRALHAGQSGVLTKLPGIGKKTAERLILELKDKVQTQSDAAQEDDDFSATAPSVGDDRISEAAAALTALGYTAAEIAPVLKRSGDCKTVEETIKFALRAFAGGK